MRRRGSRDTQYTVQYSKCHSSRSTTSARPWGNHAYSARAWGRAFLSASYNCANDRERLRMAEGLGKGAGLTFLAMPMVEAFAFTQPSISVSCPTTSACKERFAFRIHTTAAAA